MPMPLIITYMPYVIFHLKKKELTYSHLVESDYPDLLVRVSNCQFSPLLQDVFRNQYSEELEMQEMETGQ